MLHHRSYSCTGARSALQRTGFTQTTNNVTLARKILTLAALAVLAGALTGHSPASPAQAKLDDWRVEWGQYVAQEIVRQLTEACPMSDPGDQKAFESCQKTLFASAFLKDNMRDHFSGAVSSRIPASMI